MERQPKKIQIGLIKAEDLPKGPEGRIWMIADEGRIVRPGMYQYHFVTRNGLPLALVRESDVAALESKTEGCCGRPRKFVYRRATGEEISRWQQTSQPQDSTT